MDIILATHSDNPTLQFRNITRFSDNSGYRADLLVRSGGFSVEQPFYFEVESLRVFIENLERMDQELKGKAILKPMFEDHFIEIELGNAGHVSVHGQVIEYSEMSQSMKFKFRTDQTCLAPFIRELKKWQQLDAT